tara:strand:- start:303 stop:698 length:396 start_codon:yes stop_codon:yes gene_type:complete
MYEPQVDDYVIWKRPSGDWEEGWVYFKGDPVDNKKRVKDGWNSVSRYITIETSIRPKPEQYYSSGKPMLHKYIHTLLLCNEDCWGELHYVKNRRTREIQHYSQYDDISGNEDKVNLYAGYKAQENRYSDIQ